jgi:hypothetical protein
MLAALMRDHAEQVQGVGVVGPGGQDLVVQPGRLVEAATAMLLQGQDVGHGDLGQGSGVRGQRLGHQDRRRATVPP